MKNMAGLALLMALGFMMLSIGAATAQADPITVYTDRALFMAATTNTTTITFEGLAPVGGIIGYGSPSGLTLSGVNFVGRTTSEGFPVYVLSVANLALPIYDYGSGAVLSGPSTIIPAFDGITATLPSGVTAIGSDVMALDIFPPFGQTVVVTLADGTSQIFAAETLTRPERGFIGFTSTVPILSVRFRANGGTPSPSNRPLLDNFIFGQAAEVTAVPEPATVLLLSMGLAGVGATVRKRRKRATS